jgi:hypothetical protein
MIKQAYVSKSLEGLDFLGKYNLTDYVDSKRPLVVFGMYREEDIHVLKYHTEPISLVFQGSDALILSDAWAEIIRERKDVKVYAISHWISQSLTAKRIEHKLVPISATPLSWYDPQPLGDSIYFYSSDSTPANFTYYGGELAKEVERRTGIDTIFATLNTFDKDELYHAYKNSFINLRLTQYDGCPNGVLEMGLMGRPSVFNGDLPQTWKWENVDMICDAVNEAYKQRKSINPQIIADEFKNFLNINLDFLQI